MHGKIGREPGGGGEPAPVPGKSAGIAAAIVTASVVGIGLSLSIPLLSIRLEIEGHSASAIGVQTAFGALATLFGAPLVPTLAAKMGVRRLLLAAVALGATTLIAFAVLPGYWPWLALRIVYGGALTVIFVMSEYWINALAPADRRGMVLGIYATALSLGFAAGPALLGFTGATGSSPFVAGAALFALAAIPLGLAGASAPPLGREPHGGVMRFLGAAPAATFAALLVGAIEAGAMGLLPVFALRTGLGADFGAMLVTLFALGNVLVQIPIGMISDRMDRRRLLLIIALAGLVGAIALPVAAAMGPRHSGHDRAAMGRVCRCDVCRRTCPSRSALLRRDARERERRFHHALFVGHADRPHLSRHRPRSLARRRPVPGDGIDIRRLRADRPLPRLMARGGTG